MTMKLTGDTASANPSSEAGPGEKLERSVELQNVLLNSLAEGVAVLKNRRYVWVNRAMTEISGFAEDELLGRTTAITYASADEYERVGREAYATISGGGTYDDEVLIRRKDLETRWVRVKGRAIDVADLTKGSIWVNEDITERKQAEDRLRDSEAELRAIYDGTRDGILIADPETKKFLRANQAICDMLGYTREEILRLGVRDIHPEQDLPRIEENFRRMMSGEIRSPEDIPLMRKDGSVTYVDIQGSHIQIGGQKLLIGSFRDISERKLSADRLLRSESKYRQLHESMMDGFARIDMQGKIVDTNESFRQMLGYNPEQLTQLTYLDLSPEKWHTPEQRIIEEQVLPKGHSEVYEKEYRRKDGTIFPVELRAFLIKNDDRSDGGMWAIVRDITERKRAEEELRAINQDLEARVRERTRDLSAILSAIPDLMVEIDENGRYVDVWARQPELLVTPRDFLIGRTVAEVMPPEAAAECMAALRDAAAVGHSFGRQNMLPTPDGPRWFELSVALKPDLIEPIKRFIAISRDISRRKLDEQRLHDELAFREQIIESLPGIFYVFDTTDRTLAWNRNLEVFTGLDADKLVMTHPLDRVDGDDRAPVADAIQRVLATGSATVEARLRGADGSRVPFLLSGTRIERNGQPVVIGMGIDISGRRAAESALEESRSLLQTIIDTAPIRVFWKDRKLRYLGCNPAFATDAGKASPTEVVGKDDYQMVWAAQADAYRADDLAVIKSGVPKLGYEEPQTTPDGRTIWLNTSKVPLRNSDNEIVGVLGVYQDITERKQARESLRLLNEELEARVMNRTAQFREAKDAAEEANQAKTQFLTRMSHELRTPLNSMLGYAQILDASPDETPLGHERECIDAIVKSGWYLLRLIKDLLDLTAIESDKLELQIQDVDASACIDECLTTVGPMAGERAIELGPVLECRGRTVVADRDRLKQVLLNLLSNAVKYNRRGGRITLSCEALPPDHLRISITDTGAGIAAADLPLLFEPFARFNERAFDIEGIGIGLAITKELVERMGGTIGVTSVPGQRSTFWIELKEGRKAAPTGVAELGGKAPEPAGDRPGKTFKMLYIEDSPSHVGLMRRIVADLGELEMITAHTASLGLELARAHRPTLILCDICLPGMDGYELLRHLLSDERTRQIPVAAISASAMPQEIERGLAAGFRRYISKPIDIVEFRKMVGDLLSDEAAHETHALPPRQQGPTSGTTPGKDSQGAR